MISRIIEQNSPRPVAGCGQLAEFGIDRVLLQDCYPFIGLLIFILIAWPITNTRAQTVDVGTGSQSSSGGSEGGGEAGGGFLSRLPINFSVGVRGGYDDNANMSGFGGSGSTFTTATANLSYGLQLPRSYLSVRAGGEFTYYFDLNTGQSNNTNIYMDLSLVHNLSERFQLIGTLDASYRTEPDFRSDVGLQNVRSNFLNATGMVSASYNLTQRMSLVTSFNVQRIKYDSFSLGLFQDRYETTFGESIRYSLLPVTTTVLLNYSYQVTDYDTFPLDSTTHTFLFGIDEGLTTQLKVTVQGGATLRSYVVGGDTTNPDVQAVVTYTGAHNSSLSWTTSYTMEEPNSINAQSRKTISTGLNATYAVTDRITATADIYYHHNENQGFAVGGRASNTFSSDDLDMSLGLHYDVQGGFSIDLSWQYTEVSSQMALQSYSRNQYSAGINYRY